MDAATATPSPGEHGDSTSGLPSKRLCLTHVCTEVLDVPDSDNGGQRSGSYERGGQHIPIQRTVWRDICSKCYVRTLGTP